MPRYAYDYDDRWPRYVPVAERRAAAVRTAKKLEKNGRVLSPVRIDGRRVTRTFWGNAWCQNLEAYSDYSNRLPRGRTYVRNGSVVDLKIAPGKIDALVQGSDMYTVSIVVTPAEAKRWQALRQQCVGKLDSLVDLLAGKFSDGIMHVMTDKGSGLFPSPKEIKLDGSCPDWADMCKHVAAVLYGVGARLDEKPELLFSLRKVDHGELLGEIGASVKLAKPQAKKTLDASELESVFGIELDAPASKKKPAARARPSKSSAKRNTARRGSK